MLLSKVDNLDLKSIDELDTIVEDSLKELEDRYKNNKEKYNDENIYVIGTHEYIYEPSYKICYTIYM